MHDEAHMIKKHLKDLLGHLIYSITTPSLKDSTPQFRTSNNPLEAFAHSKDTEVLSSSIAVKSISSQHIARFHKKLEELIL